MKVRHAALSDIGLMRKENEDRFLLDEGRKLFGVADGIGGLPHGAEAAALVVEGIRSRLAPRPPTLDELKAAVTGANTDVKQAGLRLNPMHGIGSTLTLGCLMGRQLNLVHAGDSRCYVWRRGRITQATIDHNVEHDPHFTLRFGMSEAVYERQRSALTRCLGQVEELDLECHRLELDEGDRVLFATDGLFRAIPEEELAERLGNHEEPELALRDLVALANERGGADNATGVLLFVE
jgi:protein phosphatase